MKITLTPVRMDAQLEMRRERDVLVINGADVDLSLYDAYAAPCDWIIGRPVLGEDGWEVTVILPHGPEAPQETLFPAPVTVTGDGPVDLPPWGAVEPEPAPAQVEDPGPEGWTTHD